ncbi:MAG: oligosaccharide flippase family protein [Fibrobacteria bacterium]
MSNTLRKVARNIVHFLCSNAVSFVLGMAASIVMARSLGPNDLGIFHQVSWFAGTISVIISLGFITSITKFTAQFRAEGRSGDVLSAVRFIFYIELGIAVVTTIGLLPFSAAIADHYFSRDQKWIFMLAFMAITPGIQTAIFSATLEGAQVFRYQTVHSLTVTPAALLLKVYVMMNDWGLASLFWINLIFSVVNLGFFYFAARREGLLRGWFKFAPSDGKWKQEILGYNKSSIGIHFVDLVVWSRSENYFLGRYCLAPQIAYYNLAQNLIVKLTGTLPNLMWRILLPLSAEHHGRNETEKMKKTYHHALRYSAFFVFPTVAICFLAAYELIVIFYGHAYSETKDCFQILCGGALLSSLAQPGSAVIYASNRQHFILKYGAVLAVLNIALCFWLVPLYGARGAAFCYSSTTSLGVIGGFIYTSRKMDLAIPWSSWLKCGGATAVMSLIMSALLRIESPAFSLFQPMQLLLFDWTGHDADILLGSRAVRLLFACAVSGLAYLVMTLILFKPKEDDRRILAAMHRFLPRSITWFLDRKLPADGGVH